MHRLHAWLVGGLAICVLGAGYPALASGESLKISLPNTQSVGQPLSITAEGVADGSHRLYAYADESRSACGADPQAEYSRRPGMVALLGAEGEALPAGGFSRSFVYTPAIQLPVICAYLDSTPSSAPDAFATNPEPVNEYLKNEEQAKPVGESTSTSPGAIQPLPVNPQLAREYWERLTREARMHQEHERELAEEVNRRIERQSPFCVVPSLRGRSLQSARAALRRAHCKLGAVRRRTGGVGALVVVGQNRLHGRRLRSGSSVAVTLAQRKR